MSWGGRQGQNYSNIGSWFQAFVFLFVSVQLVYKLQQHLNKLRVNFGLNTHMHIHPKKGSLTSNLSVCFAGETHK